MLKTIPLLLENMQCLLSNLKGDSLAPEVGKTTKNKIAKISINLRVCVCSTKTYSS